MNLPQKRRALSSRAVFLLAGCTLIAAGCKGNDPAAPAAAAGQKAAAGGAGTQPPAPWQEAAKQRAIQQGPAIEAALQAQQQGQPVQPGK